MPLFRFRLPKSLSIGLAWLLAAGAAAAPHVYSPIVEPGEWELETRYDHTYDYRASKNGAYTYNVDVGYGFNRYWAAEIETQWKHDPLGRLVYDSTAVENIFQLTPQGEYWLDLGIYTEYEAVTQKGDHDSVTVGPLLQKDFGRNVTTLNLFFRHAVGGGSAGGFQVDTRFQSVWRVSPHFAPGVEAYWEPGKLGAFAGVDRERLRMGPAATGGIHFGPGHLKYEAAYLFGVTGASEHGSVRALLEYEMRF